MKPTSECELLDDLSRTFFLIYGHISSFTMISILGNFLYNLRPKTFSITSVYVVTYSVLSSIYFKALSAVFCMWEMLAAVLISRNTLPNK